MTAPASLTVPTTKRGSEPPAAREKNDRAAFGPAHTGHSLRRNSGQPDPKLVLLLASGAGFVATLDLTVVNIAFPDLRADFPSASLPTLSWVVTAYGVAFAALLSTAGRIADVIGRQRLFVWSVAAFTVTSVFAAVASNEGFLILARALQGVAAAGMSPASLGLVLTWTPRERVMAAIGVWGATASVATAVGPALGGVLVDAWGWRVIFLINIPFGLAILYGAMTRLARDTPGGRRLPDPVGTVLLAAGTGAVVISLTRSSEWGWTSGPVLLPLAGGMLGIGAGLLRSARHPVPALELDLWRDRTFTVANTVFALFSASAFALLFNGPLFLTAVWDYSVLDAGLALTPAAFASGVGAVIAGKRATTPNARRAAAVVGCLLVAAGGFFLSAQLGAQARFAEVYLPASLVAGVGFGAAFTALFGAGATSIPPARFASGSGALAMTRQLGGTLGVAAMAGILAASGYADAEDPYLAAYLFCGVVAVVAAAASVGLVRAGPVADVAADTIASFRDGAVASGAGGGGRRGRVAAALVGVAALAGLGVFTVTANPGEVPLPAPQAAGVDEDVDGGEDEAPQASPGSMPAPASRSLVLIDVSASMGEQADADTTWLQATTRAVEAGAESAPEITEMGIWLAGSRFQDERDWVELLPVGPLGGQVGPATRRQMIQSGLSQVGAVPDDRLGLYDAVLAAFRAMNSTYQPDRGNAVVVFTDGRNDDPAGLTSEHLLDALAAEFDPTRPVHVHVIGYADTAGTGHTSAGGADDGGGVDHGALRRIAEATRGGMHAVRSPQHARELFGAMMPRTA